MSRLLGRVATDAMTAREALGGESPAALLRLASLLADGWSIA